MTVVTILLLLLLIMLCGRCHQFQMTTFCHEGAGTSICSSIKENIIENNNNNNNDNNSNLVYVKHHSTTIDNNNKNKVLYFVLGNERIQYIMKVNEQNKQLEHLHYGIALESIPHSLPSDPYSSGGAEYANTYKEFPVAGGPDDRETGYAFQRLLTGDQAFDFLYNDYEIINGKPNIPGLPSTYVEHDSEAMTLIITLKDSITNVFVKLYYTIFRYYDAIARHTEVLNHGNESIQILKLSSWTFDVPPSHHESGYHFLQLQGAWAREAHEVWNQIKPGKYLISDTEGSRTHKANPFFALGSGIVTEDTGTVMGFSHVYSGAFQGVIQQNQFGLHRVIMGLHPEFFQWRLEPHESIHSPETIGVYSSQGLGGMSRTYHRLYRERLIRGEWRDKVRPILLNTWEAMYFNFTEESLLELATSALGTGVELFVLDDGWFGKRNNDASSLGDWYPNLEKLPNGLDGLANKLNDMGFQFGIWVEPEMINRDSELYRNYPEWVIEAPNRYAPEMRNQLMLDLTNPNVLTYLLDTFTKLFTSANIVYVKWDHNRYFAGTYGNTLTVQRQGEFAHRYILALYELVSTLTNKFPHILFENCASGGGRFDPGMMAYMPQTWASDNTDAEERMYIQWGLSYVYPLSTIGTHVSTIPNHQVHRSTPWNTRVTVAHFGTYGYELNMMTMSSEEKQVTNRSSIQHLQIRHIVYFGDFYRLRNPFISNWSGWMCVTQNQSEAIVLLYQRLMHTRLVIPTVPLRGLNPIDYYQIEVLSPESSSGRKNDRSKVLDIDDTIYSGLELMTRGIAVNFNVDFEAIFVHLTRINKTTNSNASKL